MAARTAQAIARLLDQPLALTSEQFDQQFVPLVSTFALDTLDQEFVRGISRHGIAGAQAAVALRFAGCVLLNPGPLVVAGFPTPGSNVSVEVELANALTADVVAVTTGSRAATLDLLAGQTDLSANIRSRNTEWGAAVGAMPGQARVITGDSAATFASGLEQIIVTGAGPFVEFLSCRKLRLAPGTALLMGSSTANVQLTFNFGWREVPIAQNAR